MKKNFFSELPLNLVYQLAMNTERVISIMGLMTGLLVFFFQQESLQSSSLPLLVISILGFILSFRFSLVGNSLLFFGGASLMLQPFLFTSLYSLVPAGVFLTCGGLIGIIKWWKQNNN